MQKELNKMKNLKEKLRNTKKPLQSSPKSRDYLKRTYKPNHSYKKVERPHRQARLSFLFRSISMRLLERWTSSSIESHMVLCWRCWLLLLVRLVKLLIRVELEELFIWLMSCFIRFLSLLISRDLLRTRESRPIRMLEEWLRSTFKLLMSIWLMLKPSSLQSTIKSTMPRLHWPTLTRESRMSVNKERTDGTNARRLLKIIKRPEHLEMLREAQFQPLLDWLIRV